MYRPVLRSLYSESPGPLVFKAGTALMFAFGLRRFSDDLDFTRSPSLDVRKLVVRAATDLRNLGKTSTPKQESDRWTWEPRYKKVTLQCRPTLFKIPEQTANGTLEPR